MKFLLWEPSSGLVPRYFRNSFDIGSNLNLQSSLPKIPLVGLNNNSVMYLKVLVDQLVDCIAHNCSELERLELRWDAETLRYSDKSQKAIDMLRVRCLRLHCLVLRFVHSHLTSIKLMIFSVPLILKLTSWLSDGKYYETVKANFERADRNTVVRTVTNSRVTNCYLLSCYQDLLFN